MFCPTCGEVMVFGPAGCACTRKSKQEAERRGLERTMTMLEKLRWAELDIAEPEEP